jgi:hypothetical protein
MSEGTPKTPLEQPLDELLGQQAAKRAEETRRQQADELAMQNILATKLAAEAEFDRIMKEVVSPWLSDVSTRLHARNLILNARPSITKAFSYSIQSMDPRVAVNPGNFIIELASDGDVTIRSDMTRNTVPNFFGGDKRIGERVSIRDLDGGMLDETFNRFLKLSLST